MTARGMPTRALLAAAMILATAGIESVHTAFAQTSIITPGPGGGSSGGVIIGPPPGGGSGGGVIIGPTIPSDPAEIRSVSVTPSTFGGEAGKDLSLSLTWTVALTPASPTVDPVDLVSKEGLLDGERVAGALSKRNAAGTVTFSERLRLDRRKLTEALANGRETLTYTRTFRADGSADSASVRVDLSGSFLTDVKGSVIPDTVPAGRPVVATINWALDIARVGRGAPITVRSNGGVLSLDDGSRLRNAPGDPLVRPGLTGPAMVTERLNLSAAATIRALREGSTRLLYTREFTDGLSRFEKTVVLNLTSPGGLPGTGKLTISYVGLQFTDESTDTIVPAGQKLRARADITTQNIGRLNGVWEIAKPPSTLGKPFFATLRVVNTTTGSSGERSFFSPPLPTTEPGTYLVRFRLREPTTDNTPIIRYIVRRDADARPMQLIQPFAKSVVNEKTRFSWQGLSTADSYLLEILASGGGKPACGKDEAKVVAGISLKSNVGSTRLSPLTARRLESGSGYCWRIRAFRDKRQVAISDTRLMYWMAGDATQAKAPDAPQELEYESTDIVTEPGLFQPLEDTDEYPAGHIITDRLVLELQGREGEYPAGHVPTDPLILELQDEEGGYPAGYVVTDGLVLELQGGEGEFPAGYVVTNPLVLELQDADDEYPARYVVTDPLVLELQGEEGEYPAGYVVTDPLVLDLQGGDDEYPASHVVTNSLVLELQGEEGEYPAGYVVTQPLILELQPGAGDENAGLELRTERLEIVGSKTREAAKDSDEILIRVDELEMIGK